MSPRGYNLGKREDGIADTRRRILDGATDAYLELGVRGTSMQEVARRADVAPATVLNHFNSPNELVEAVVVDIIEELAVPEPSVFDEVSDEMDRVRILIEEMYDFYERSDRWLGMFTRERDVVPAFQEGERTVRRSIGSLVVQALGDRSGDTELGAIVTAAIHPGFCHALVEVSQSLAAAKTNAQQLVEAWSESHRS